jgi:hypothetical protein
MGERDYLIVGEVNLEALTMLYRTT